MLQDARIGLRRVMHAPGFLLAVSLILGLGIAAAATMGSVLYALALRPLSLPDPNALVSVGSYDKDHLARATPLKTLDSLRAANLPVDYWCAQGNTLDAVESGGRVLEANIDLMSGDCDKLIGLNLTMGRWFSQQEAPVAGNATPVIVITDRFWKRMFDGAPGVLGRSIRVRDVTAVVIGVLPSAYDGLSPDTATDFVIPYNAHRPASGSARYLGRLKPDTSLASLQAQIKITWPQLLAAVLPASPTRAQSLSEWNGDAESIAGGFSVLRRLYAEPLRKLALLTAVLLVLVAVNVGGLLVTRFATRLPEINAMRAIGAGNVRIVRPLVVESAALALGGTLVSLPLTIVASARFLDLLPTGNVPWTIRTTPDSVVFAAVAAAFILLALTISTVPICLIALQPMQLRTDRTVSRSWNRSAQVMLVSQVALTVTLVFVCGLVVRSFYGLQRVDRGYRADHLLSLRLSANPGGYKDLDAASYYRELVSRLNSLPGVESAGLARYFGTISAQMPETPVGFAGNSENVASAAMDFVSPGFFQTIGVPLLRGRDVLWTDVPASGRVAVVSENVAKMLDAGGDVVGRRIRYGASAAYADVQIIGVVGNISIGNLRRNAERMIYVPAVQTGDTAFASAHMRTLGPPMEMATAATDAVRALGREHTLGAYSDMLFGNSVTAERMGTAVSSIIATLAVIVSCVGVFALLSHTVQRRTREIGIRMAVGATPSSVSRLILNQAVSLVAIGLAVGIPGALVATSLVRSLLFGVTSTDAATLITSQVLLLISAIAAALHPTLRAVRVDPAIALRTE